MRDAEGVLAAVLERPDDEAAWQSFAALDEEGQHAVSKGLKARVDELVRACPPDALPVAGALVRSASGMKALEPLALRGRALAHAYNGMLEEARSDYEAAALLYDQRGDAASALEGARVRRSLVEVHHLCGCSAEALRCAETARVVFEREGERRLLAQLEVNVGNVHTRLDEYPLARECYLRARELFTQEQDGFGRAVAEFDLAVVEMNANLIDQAEAYWQSARLRFEEAGARMWVADCDYSLSYLAARRGEYSDALAGLGEARTAYEGCGKPSGVPLCDLDLAEIYLALDARRDALQHAQRAGAAFDKLDLGYERARALALQGLARARLGEAGAARSAFERAGEIFEGLGNTGAARALQMHRAALELASGEPAEAVSQLTPLVSLLTLGGQAQLADLAATTLARAQLANGDVPAAVSTLASLLEPPAGGRLRDPLVLAEAETLRGASLRALGEEDDAMDALRRAIEHVEEAWIQLPGRDVRLAFFRERHTVYVELAWMLSDVGQADATREAICVLERGRFRSLHERPPGRTPEDPELDRARRRLDWLLSRRLAAELGGAEKDHELRALAPPEEELSRAQREVADMTRSRADAGDATRPQFDQRAMQRARGAGPDNLLVYFSAGQSMRAFVIGPDSTRTVVLDAPVERVRALRDHLFLQLDKLQLGGEYLANHASRLAATTDSLLDELGERLIAPCLAGVEPGSPLVVVPYGELHNLPFHAFRVGAEPLIANHPTSYALGLSSLARARFNTQPGATGEILHAGAGGPELPAASAELEHLQELFGARARSVSADEVVGCFPAGLVPGSVLHLASHGHFEHAAPAFSAIAVGDKFLLAHDVLQHSLPLALATLSGCETGRGLRVAGEELLGLTGALHAAGTRSVLASQWPVQDEDAQAFMLLFYARLAAGAAVRDAVTDAQRELLCVRPQTHAWAAFALSGDPDLRLVP